MTLRVKEIDKNMFEIKGFDACTKVEGLSVQNAKRYGRDNPMIRIMSAAIKNFGWKHTDNYDAYVTREKILLVKEVKK